MKKTAKKTAFARTQTVAACSEELSIPIELLRDYAMRGCPHTKGGKGKSNLFDAAEVVAWMRENNLKGKPGRPTETPDSPDIEAAKLRKENALASRHELYVARERGLLIPVDEVKQWIGSKVTTAKNKFVGMGASLAPMLEGRDAAERQTIIDARVNQILAELSKAVDDVSRT